VTPKTDDVRPLPDDFQMIVCLTCGSVWRIQRYTEECQIDAELLICPLCVEKAAKEAGEE